VNNLKKYLYQKLNHRFIIFMKNYINLQPNLYFLVLTSLFFSCSNSERIDVSQLNYEQATSIFINYFKAKPDTIYLSKFKDYFAAQDRDYLYCFKSFAKTWQEHFKFEKPIPGIHEVDWVLIDSIQHIYFVSEDSGNRHGSITFHLVSLDDVDVHYSITYMGVIGSIDQLYTPITNELKSKIKILEYLENKIANSNLIYRPSAEDLDINHPKNHIKKWDLENKEILYLVENCGEEESEIKFFYYAENIFDIWSDNEIGNISNEKFVIKSFFYASDWGYHHYNILGYDKKKNKYFVVWHVSYIDDPNDYLCEIKFVSTDSISIKDDLGTFVINLIDGKLNCIKAQNVNSDIIPQF